MDGGLVSSGLLPELLLHALQQAADSPQGQGVQVQQAAEGAGGPDVLHKQGLESWEHAHVPPHLLQEGRGEHHVHHRQLAGIGKGVHRAAVKYAGVAGAAVAGLAVDHVPPGALEDHGQLNEVMAMLMKPALHQRRANVERELAGMGVLPQPVVHGHGTIMLYFGTRVEVISHNSATM